MLSEFELMDRVISYGRPATTRTMQNAYRDGLIIALLALIPLRRRTLAALRIGKHLVRSGDLWVLDIPAEDIKTKRPLEYPISKELSERIDLYLNQIRPRIPGAGMHDYLWASSRARPMSDRIIYNTVRRRTRKVLGFPGQPAALSQRRSNTLVNPRPSQRARCQRPARSCIIRYDGEALHNGAVAPCGARSRSRRRQCREKISGFLIPFLNFQSTRLRIWGSGVRNLSGRANIIKDLRQLTM